MTAPLLDGLRWRLIGPFRGGRSVAVAGHPTDRLTFWFGSTGGGVWKTLDGGRTWANVSDGFFRRASVGALAVATSDPNVLYAGMGECCLRNTVSHGDGVYRSDDGGRTWRHCGLEATRHIGRIRVDPQDPHRVFVAALGHAHGPNPERGVYRSTDGGATWDLVLHRNADSGAVDLALDPRNPRIVYATTWQVRRVAWRIDSGGEGSGIWRSDDGGDTWQELSRKPGLPDTPHGRVGIAPSPAKDGRVWAIVEAKDGGVFRSDDWGEHWVRLSQQDQLRQRPFYYSHIHAHPTDADTVFVLVGEMWRSVDGGQSFSTIDVQHGDCHDLWLDPRDPDRLILGDDGGAAVSFDGATSWSSLLNQPTAELYHVTTDAQTPYRVYASQQDNSSLSLATHSETGAITVRDMYTVGGGECGYIAVQPDDPNVIYALDYNGELTRHDRRAMTYEHIWVWPDYRRGGGAVDERHRFNWTTPLLISPHDPDLMYQGGNVVFASHDRGQTWEPISGDLTRNDLDKLQTSGGPITQENGGAEYWCTVFALDESRLQRGLLWAGSDDGLVHVTEDGGTTWRNVTPPDMPEWATVSIVEPSPHDARTAYLAVDRHRLDDFTPYLFRTADLGATWQRIDAGIPAGEFCRVIREDPQRRGMLYCGTEAGVYVSFDDGTSWQPFRGNLPVTPVHDLVVKGDDLVAATHGRAIWILDDLPALREFASTAAATPGAVRLYTPRRWVRWQARDALPLTTKAGGGPQRSLSWAFGLTVQTVQTRPLADRDDAEMRFLDAGQNVAHGVVVLYELPEPGDRELSLTFLDSDGRELRRLTTTPADERPKHDADRKPGERDEPHPPRRAGLNRFVWNGQLPPPPKVAVDAGPELLGDTGAPVPPGRYEVRVRLGDVEESKPFEIALDPRIVTTPGDVEARQSLTLRCFDSLATLNDTVTTIRRVCKQLDRWAADDAKADDELAAPARDIRESLRAVEDRLTVRDAAGKPMVTVLISNAARLDIRLQRIIAMLAMGWTAVPRATREVAEQHIAEITAAAAEVQRTLDGAVKDFEKRLRKAGVSLVDKTAQRS